MSNSKESLAVLKGLLSGGTVSYQAIFSKAFRSIPIGVYLSQMYFWQENSRYKGKETHQQFEGRTFICRTAEEWFEETGMTTEQQTKARETLRPFGVLLEKKAGMPAKLWQHIDLSALVTVINRYLETGSPVTVDYRSKERYFTRASNGRILKQVTVKNPTTYSRELESLESKEESGRVTAPPLASVGETFTSEPEVKTTPPGGCAAPPPPGPADYPAPAVTVTAFTPPQVVYETLPSGDTLRAEVHPPAEVGAVLPGGPEPPQQPKPKAKPAVPEIVAQVIEYLNLKTGKSFKPDTKAYAPRIVARHNEGATLEEMRRVVDNRVAAWGQDDKMRQYLDPITLFRPENFPRYLVDANAPKPQQQGPSAPAPPTTRQQFQQPQAQSPIFGERRLTA